MFYIRVRKIVVNFLKKKDVFVNLFLSSQVNSISNFAKNYLVITVKATVIMIIITIITIMIVIITSRRR